MELNQILWVIITLPLSSLSDVLLSALSDGQVIKYDLASNKFINGSTVGGSLSTLSDCNVGNTFNLVGGQTLVYVPQLQKWINEKLLHDNLDHIGVNTHDQIDTLISSKGNINGLASLDGSGKVVLSQIPATAITSVNTCTNIAARDALVVQVGDVAIVTADSTSSNNGSYIYNGSSWSALTVYIQPSNLSGLNDCTISSPSSNQVLQYSTSLSKWVNSTLTTTSSLSSLNDCTITTPSNNQHLIYNTSSGK